MRIRSVIFSIGYAALTFVVSIVVIAMFWLLPRQQRSFFYALWCRAVIAWARLSCGIRFEIHGQENIPERPVVIVSNHQSTWETIFLYQLFAPVVPILKRELLKIPFWGWALRLQKPIAIDRSKPRESVRSLLSQGKERIESGMSVLVFPEGTRAEAGTVGKLSRGGAQLATSVEAPVIPVIHNAGDCWPRGSLLKRPGLVTVIIGEPIPTKDRTSREIADDYERWMDDNMQKLGLRRS